MFSPIDINALAHCSLNETDLVLGEVQVHPKISRYYRGRYVVRVAYKTTSPPIDLIVI